LFRIITQKKDSRSKIINQNDININKIAAQNPNGLVGWTELACRFTADERRDRISETCCHVFTPISFSIGWSILTVILHTKKYNRSIRKVRVKIIHSQQQKSIKHFITKHIMTANGSILLSKST